MTADSPPEALERRSGGSRDVSRERPASARDSYSVLPSGEVVAIAVSRDSRDYTVWLWSDDERLWYVPEGEVKQQVRDGFNRYEEILRSDPDRALALRERADNTVGDGNQKSVAAKVAKGAEADVEGTADGAGDSVDGAEEPVEGGEPAGRPTSPRTAGDRNVRIGA